MQTSNLSNPSLGRLGQILPAAPSSGFASQDRLFSAKDVLTRFSSDSTLIVDYLDGMASIVLYDGDQPRIFYLDRTVQLQPGVLFSVVPLETQCQVRFFLPEGGSLEEKDTVSAAFLQQGPPSLEFEQVYTFFYQQTPGSFYFHGESHRPYELVYVEKGLLHVIVEGCNVELHPQQCLLIGRNCWHIQYSDEPMQFFTASFDLKNPCLDALTGRALPVRQELRVMLERMVSELRQPSFLDDYVESLMKIFLIELLRQPRSETGGGTYPSTFYTENQIVSEILQTISHGISGKLSLHRLAEQAHVSVPYLYVLFDRHIGMPPGQYIMKIRIEESKLLLQQGQLSVGAIAERLGFSSIQHFSRQFKSLCGLSPTQYARQFR